CWCNDCPPLPAPNEQARDRAQLVQFVAELAKSLALPFAPETTSTIVTMFDETVGRALAHGIDWNSGRDFVLSRARTIAREAQRRADIANEKVLTPTTLRAAWEHDIRRTNEAAECPSAA